VIRRVRVHGARTWRIRPARLRPGAYAVRVVSGRARATLHARRL
jgi:hypothetical protein